MLPHPVGAAVRGETLHPAAAGWEAAGNGATKPNANWDCTGTAEKQKSSLCPSVAPGDKGTLCPATLGAAQPADTRAGARPVGSI